MDHLKGAPLRVAKALSDAADDIVEVGVVVVVLVDGNTDGESGGFLAALASDAVGARGPAHAPGAVVRVTRVTRALRGALGVEACLLVKRDGVRSVGVAEDVTTTTAVVTAREEGEGLSASGCSACRAA